MFDQSLVRLRAPLRRNRGGELVPDWSSDLVERVTITGVSVQPSSTDETSTAQFTSRSIRHRVFSLPGTAPDVTAIDRIEFDGDTYEVEGDVNAWPDPFGAVVLHHVEFVIRRDIGG